MVMNFLQKAHWIHERTWRYDYTGIRGTNQENLHLTEEISFPMPAVEWLNQTTHAKHIVRKFSWELQDSLEEALNAEQFKNSKTLKRMTKTENLAHWITIQVYPKIHLHKIKVA